MIHLSVNKVYKKYSNFQNLKTHFYLIIFINQYKFFMLIIKCYSFLKKLINFVSYDYYIVILAVFYNNILEIFFYCIIYNLNNLNSLIRLVGSNKLNNILKLFF